MYKFTTKNSEFTIENTNTEAILTASTEQPTETPKLTAGERFQSSLYYMGIGMLGIFTITAIIIGVVTILNKIKTK